MDKKVEKYSPAKKNGTKRFFIIYGIVFGILLLFIGVILLKLNSFLADYESGLPKYKAEEIFNNHFAKTDTEFLLSNGGLKLSEFETRETFSDFVKLLTEGKELTFREASAGLGEKKRYIVSADREKFAEFFLVKGENADENGNFWTLDSVNTYFSADETVNLEALSSSKIYINGTEISKDYITNTDIASFATGHLEDNISALSYCDYSVKGLFAKPELKSLDKNGNESVLEYNEEKKMYVEKINYGNIPAELSKRIEAAAQTYSKYMTQDASLSDVKKYFDSKSKTYFFIRTSETWCYTDHIGYRFEDTEMSEFYRFDENTFSCRYKCTQIVNRTRYESFPFYLDATFFFKKIGNDYYVYDMVVV